MAYLYLGLFALISPAATAIFYYLHKSKFGKLNYWIRQLIIGLVFGGIAILCTEFGVKNEEAVLNVRDSAPIAAGLIFGWPAGVISGFIGGIERFVSAYWRGTYYTQIACSISTIISGVVASLLNRFVYRKTKPTWYQALLIGLVLETSHILMIFVTNMGDTLTAYDYVSKIGNVMIAFVGASVALSVGLVENFNYRRKERSKVKKLRLSTIMHISLFSVTAFAYVNVALYTRNIQTRIGEDSYQRTLSNAISDVIDDVKDNSDDNLLNLSISIADTLDNRYKKSLSIDDEYLKNLLPGGSSSVTYNVSEINIVNSEGIVIYSSGIWAEEAFDMKSGEQSKEFYDHILVNHEYSYVQELRSIAADEQTQMKYAGVKLEMGGFVQVGYDLETFYSDLHGVISKVVKNRRIGTSGFFIITDVEYNIIGRSSSVSDKFLKLSDLLFTDDLSVDHIPNTMYSCKLKLADDLINYKYSYQYTEGYYILGFAPSSEINLTRDVSTYVYTYLVFITFSLVFLIIYIIVDRFVLDDVEDANEGLARITDGDLNTRIFANHSKEFIELSTSINKTVETMKEFIAKEADRLDKELALAKAIQLSTLPNKTGFLNFYEFGIYAEMQTAKEVGGDFYDYFPLDHDRFAILIADVSGKGIPAALFMMRTKSLIKSLLETGISVNEAIKRANKQLCEGNDAKMFVTCWCGVVSYKTGLVEYVNAGHNPPLLRQNGKYNYIPGKANFVLGGLEKAKYDKYELQLSPGDVIFLYTDGITEATIGNNIFYGEDRLLEYINSLGTINPKAVTEGVLNNTREFVGGHEQSDDMTLLTFSYYGSYKHYENRYVTDDNSFARAKEDLLKILEENNISPKISMKVEICFEEIYTNIIKYAYGDNVGDAIVHVDISKEQLSITFGDNGVKFNPLAKEDPDVTLSAKDRRIGGLGIFMVKNMVDSIYYIYLEKHNILMINILLHNKEEK